MDRPVDPDRPLSDHSRMEMWEVSRERIPFVEICAAGPAAVPVLEEELRVARGARAVRAWRRRWPSWVRRRGRTSWRRKSFVSWPAAPCRCGRPG